MHMPGDLFFVLSKEHKILAQYDCLSDARAKMHKSLAAQYVARIDGVVLAYMSREGNPWRAISRVPPEVRRTLAIYANVNPLPEKIEDEEPDALYPPPDPTEASSDL